MKKTMILGAVCAVLTTPVLAGPSANCSQGCFSKDAKYIIYSPRTVHYHTHRHKSHNDTAFIVGGLAVGLVVGYMLWNRPVDITHAKVRF